MTSLRLRRDRRPPERRQIDAAECAAGHEGQHRQPKPQTTRHRILGILTRPEAQSISSTRRACIGRTPRHESPHESRALIVPCRTRT
jgi:hypothetical protein